MNRRQLYQHFIITDWNGLGTKIKNMKKKKQQKKNEKI